MERGSTYSMQTGALVWFIHALSLGTGTWQAFNKYFVNCRNKCLHRKEGLYVQCICKNIQDWLTLGVRVVGIFWQTCIFLSLQRRCIAVVVRKQASFTMMARLLPPHLPPFSNPHFSTSRSNPRSSVSTRIQRHQANQKQPPRQTAGDPEF